MLDIEDDVWERWQRERATGQGWKDVTEWRRLKKKTVTIIREGTSRSQRTRVLVRPSGRTTSCCRSTRSFVGSPEAYAALDDGLNEPQERRAYAAEHKKVYEIYLRWSSLKANLQYNGFADDTVAVGLPLPVPQRVRPSDQRHDPCAVRETPMDHPPTHLASAARRRQVPPLNRSVSCGRVSCLPGERGGDGDAVEVRGDVVGVPTNPSSRSRRWEPILRHSWFF
ncbi:hypothetical protein [Actinophytocola sp. KF-1]